MAKINLEKAYAVASAGAFGGLDCGGMFGKPTQARTMENFRVLGDGSLEKRCGYSLSVTLPCAIRAIWSGELGGLDTLMALAGSNVYLIDPETDTYSTVGTVGTSSGGGCFFVIEGKLYLIDGGDVYNCTRSAVTPVSGYVPLYGKSWSVDGGEVNEPINQLSRYVRIAYKLTESSTRISTVLTASSVVYVRVNGVAASNYTLNGTTIQFSSTLANGTALDVCLELGTSCNERSALAACSGAAVYGGMYDTSVYCFGGADKSRVFHSRYVGAGDAASSRAAVSGAGDLYFPVGSDFYVASGSAEVTAVCRHYDRLLLFSDDSARMIELSEGGVTDIPVMPVNSGVGCLGATGVVHCGNDPVTVSRDGIYRWTDNTDQRDESNAVKISLPVDDVLDEAFRDGAVAFNYRVKDEIWFANPSDADGRVFIYNYRGGMWYCFTGIQASMLFSCGDGIGFCDEDSVYIFNESDYSDCGKEISAVYESRMFDMERPGKSKKLKHCLAVSSGGSDFTVTLSGDSIPTANEVALSFKGSTGGADIDRHVRRIAQSTGRLAYVKYSIAAGGSGRQRIFGITLTAGK